MNLLRLLKVASCVLALVLASLASEARAQVSTASIVGTIVDSSGAAVSGATVTAAAQPGAIVDDFAVDLACGEVDETQKAPLGIGHAGDCEPRPQRGFSL